MIRRVLHIVLPLLALASLVAACGPAPASTTNNPATQTRSAEVGQIATLQALVAATATPGQAGTPTPHIAATQTRTGELAQLATLTAPTPTRTAAPAGTPAGAPTPTVGPAVASGSIVTFVGRVSNTEALVGLITDGSKTTVYFCDGSSMSRWFSGTLTGNRLELSAADGASMTAEIPAGTKEVKGTLKLPDGTALAFGSLATTGRDNAGLFRTTGTVSGEPFTMGVIVLPDGPFAGILARGRTLHSVTDPRFGQDSLTATVAGLPGTFTAPRMTAP